MRFPRILLFLILEFVFEKKTDKLTQTLMRFPRVPLFLSLEFVFEKKIRTNSLKLKCDFPGFWYVSSLNLNLEFFQMIVAIINLDLNNSNSK